MSDCATLTVRLLRGVGLRSSDSHGYADPYVLLHVGEAPPWRSPTRPRTVDPIWGVQAIFERVHLNRTPYAVAELWDSDVTTTDDPLGKVILPIGQLLLACADGLECELPLGKRDARYQAQGSLWVHLSAVPDLSLSHTAGLGLAAPPPAPLPSPLPAAS